MGGCAPATSASSTPRAISTSPGGSSDLIILGGQNLVPADVEEIVDRVDGVRYSAAVGIENERTGSQRLHVVAEVREPAAPPEAMSRLVRDIVQRVHEGRGHRPARVLLVVPGTIPKTSSGKIQRAPRHDDRQGGAGRPHPLRLRRSERRAVRFGCHLPPEGGADATSPRG